MTRNLKAMGLALVASLALSAVVASAASAAPAKFTASVPAGQFAHIHGGQIGKDVFTVEGKELTCVTATLTGTALTQGPESTEVTLTPKYETCHTMLTIAGLKVTRTATVTMNGCAYKFNATKSTGGKPFTADLTIECPLNQQIEIHDYNTSAHANHNTVICTFDIKHQTINDAIELTNTPGKDIVAHINAPIAVHNTILNATCGVNTNPASILHGEDTLTATNDAGANVASTVS